MAVDSIQDLVKELTPAADTKPKTYTAEVSHTDEEGIVWVRLPGADQDTPTASASAEVKMGDTVNVEWRNNRLYIAGNYSNPSAGVTRVIKVEQAAQIANGAAQNAVDSANTAQVAAESAQASAASAETAANAAQASATNASEYAARALCNLSTVQSVTETLAWITQHGTMTLTTDTALDPTHVYFVQDAQGDYVVGGQHYAVVSEPSASALSTYYVLSIDESLNNYVAVHLAVTDEGLWLLPDAGGNKVLIATGSGTTYTSAGTYIIGAGGAVLASFLASGAQIGQTGQSHIEMDYRSMKLINKEGNAYFYASDLRDQNGEYPWTQTWTGNGSTRTFSLDIQANNNTYTVTVNGTEVTGGITKSRDLFSFASAPAVGDVIEASYKTSSQSAVAFTLGTRTGTVAPGSVVLGNNAKASGVRSLAAGLNTKATGVTSFAEGSSTTASGLIAHSEGQQTEASGHSAHAEGGATTASGSYSHAEGNSTTAAGYSSHAQNSYTVAGYSDQTAIGKYNNNKQNNAFEIGNGSSSARSNAFEVDWNGNTKAAGNITDGSGNVLADKADASDLADYLPLTGGTLTGDLTVGGHSSPIGRIVTGSETISVPSTTGSPIKRGDGFTLDAGSWSITMSVTFPANSTGYRRVAIGAFDDAYASSRNSASATGGYETPVLSVALVTPSSSTTYYAYLHQNSGSTLNSTVNWRAVRMA